MSGGQQRRVSLACALIHSPPLLILDEPTVGTDPVLRHSIWTHLLSLSRCGHTIILTTHYIEESTNAKTVAFMRSGKILVEDNPKALLDKYALANLEDVFLKLCLSTDNNSEKNSFVKQNLCYDNQVMTGIELEDDHGHQHNQDTQDSNISTWIPMTVFSINIENDKPEEGDIPIANEANVEHRQKDSSNDNVLLAIRNSTFNDKFCALLHKNFKRVTRNWGHLFFELIISTMMFTVFFLSLGDGPTNMNLAIFNAEIIYNNISESWGQMFIDCIEKDLFHLNYFSSFNDAISSVKLGENHAAIDINERFTKSLNLRIIYLSETNEETLKESQIHVHIDRSNYLIGQQIEVHLLLAMNKFIALAANTTRINPDIFNMPLDFEEPIYGNSDHTLKDFMIPGQYVTMVFYVTSLLTAHMIIDERREGLLERSVVAGVSALEFLLSNLLTMLIIGTFQLSLLLFIPYALLGIRISGSIPLLLALLLSQGLCGVGLGLVISSLIYDITIAGLVLYFLYLSAMMTTGTMWPIENMPSILQYISKFHPNTMPIQAVRSIIYREWTIDFFEVYIGFVVTYIWFTIFIVITLLLLKRQL